ncbi:mitochondrial import receptor subunit TOM40 [Pancytospora epiphaga]|nr:mitochondrial import receptor subunit TOM40 [Pancytospora epiphaga]
MALKFWKIWNYKKVPLLTSYDTRNSVIADLTTTQKYNGIKCEITRTLTPFLQLTTIKTGASLVPQVFTTFSFPSSVFQFCFDTDRNYQFRSSMSHGPITTKLHSIVSARKEVYSQLESMYNSVFFNIGFKIISPTLYTSNLIYVFNYWRSLGRVCLGFEVVGVNGDIGLSASSRIEGDNSVFCLSLQRFNMVTASIYRRCFKKLDVGLEITRDSSNFHTAAGARLRNYKSDLKLTIDQSLRLGFEWDEKLTENITVNFNSTYDEDGFIYGIGVVYDS